MKISKKDLEQLIFESLLTSDEPESEMKQFTNSKPGKKAAAIGSKIASAGKALGELGSDQTGSMRKALYRFSEFVYKIGKTLSELDQIEEGSSASTNLPTVSELKNLQKSIKLMEKIK